MKLFRVWLCWLLAPVAITFIHEVGHLLFALVFGAAPMGIVVGPFGGGYAKYDEANLGHVGARVALAGGMLLNVMSGVAFLVTAQRLRQGSLFALALTVVGPLSLVFVTFYLFIGLHSGIGDLADILRLSEVPHSLHPLFEALCVLGVFVTTYLCASEFVRHQSALWPNEPKMKRIVRAAMMTLPWVVSLSLRVLVFDPSGVSQVFSQGPRATMEILAELEINEPDLDGSGRLQRTAEILRARRALGPVDNALVPAWDLYLLCAAMAAVGAVAVARTPRVQEPTT